MILTSIIQAQCAFDISADIEDLQTTELQIVVENLINDDMAGTQAICAIELHFQHSYLGDLTIELTSPAGQTVQLVGAVTDQINPTNLTTWDVRFLQCGFPASPDPGFTALWNNDQAWQVFTTYTGSYYPSSGCLEDFNIGSANGLWLLSITDHDAPQTGELLGVTLIFCDDAGLDCSVCGAQAGVFPQTLVSICEGTEVSLEPVYLDTVPDTALYGYTFYFTTDHMSSIFTGQIITSAMSPGTYTICGMSFSHSDSSDLFAQLDTMSFDEIQQAFVNDAISVCADITETCVTLLIHPFIDPTFVNQQICAGSSVTVGGQTFSAEGTHVVSIDVSGPCDSVVVLDLNIIVIEAMVVQEDTISCANGVTTLNGSISIAGPGASYAWSTTNGTILSAEDQAIISIDGGGSYALIVTYQGCSDDVLYDVIGDSSIPFLFVQGGTIDCNNPGFMFTPVAFPSDVQYLWNGPANFTSSDPRPVVTVPGVYSLEITNSAGCSVSASVEILIDTTVNPAINIVRKECEFQRATLQASPNLQGTEYFWTSPSGLTSTYVEYYATISGQYCVEITPLNGCVVTECFDYIEDYAFPDLTISASSDSLHCASQVQLIATSLVPDLSYQWFGPGGLLAGDSVININSPGQYIVQGTGVNQCTARDTVIIYPGDDLIEFGVFTDTLDCNIDTVLIGVAILDPMVAFTWTGPGLVDTFEAFVQVTQPGSYYVTIISQSGCEQHATVPVVSDLSTVSYALVLDTITCVDPIANLGFTAFAAYEFIDWVLPDGSHSNQAILGTTEPGEYLLTITGVNGCPRTLGLILTADTIPPILFVESETLGCNDSVQVRTILVDSIQSYAWSGPGSFSSSDAKPFVTLPGVYILEATGENGCTSNYVHFVESDMTFPSLSVTAEELDCIDSSAVLIMMSLDTALTFAWYSQGLKISDSAIVEVMNPGQYTGSATNSNGCVTIDSVEVLPAILPEIFIQLDTITCNSGATLTATSNLPDIIFLWEDAGGMTAVGPEFTAMQPGPVILSATGVNGCIRDTTIFIEADTLAPVAIAASNEMVLCSLQTITLDASGSLGQISEYLWSTSDGIIASGAGTASPVITGEGTYIVRVTDASNGCTDSDTIYIAEGQSMLGVLYLTAISECEGNGSGSISIDSVPGAATTLTYSINDETGGPFFNNLSVGQYHIVALDSFGCSTDTIIHLSNTSSTHTISLGEDQSILIGDSVLLEAIVDLDPLEIMSVQWGQPVGCGSCLSNVVSPIHTTTFEVFLTDIFGCIASDVVTVFVEEQPKFFIPNIFSPNGDEINDHITIITHPGIERILSFRIYDRWGNVVFEETNFPGNDNAVRWDGTFGGKELNPAVFVYILEIVLLSGRVETNHGTVTLVK